MANLQIQISTQEFGSRMAKVATFIGAADSSNVAEVDRQVLAIVETTDTLLLDCIGLEFANSTFIGHLTDWYSQLTEKGGSIALLNLQPNVLDTLQVVGLLNLIPHFHSFAEAEEKLSGTGQLV
jgi:anti-anti-sigma factor